jgi:hypothetical protein|tara:strand:+ start:12554 stop:12970 length:417 start_codon:yes stop_codon:yes gene_type:complete
MDSRDPPLSADFGDLNAKLHRLAVSQHELFSAFAATKFAKNGKGALFVFTNCGLANLLVEEGEAGFEDASALRRQMFLVWGGVTDKAAPDCTVMKLTEKLAPSLRTNIGKSILAPCTRDNISPGCFKRCAIRHERRAG